MKSLNCAQAGAWEPAALAETALDGTCRTRRALVDFPGGETNPCYMIIRKSPIIQGNTFLYKE